MSAELQARRTVAAAVPADCQRNRDRFCDRGSREPDAIAWCGRLGIALESLLEQLDREKPDPAAGQLARRRSGSLLDSFDWETDDRPRAAAWGVVRPRACT